jgi:hypothetical protein
MSCSYYGNVLVAKALEERVDDRLQQRFEVGAEKMDTHRHNVQLKAAVQADVLKQTKYGIFDENIPRLLHVVCACTLTFVLVILSSLQNDSPPPTSKFKSASCDLSQLLGATSSSSRPSTSRNISSADSALSLPPPLPLCEAAPSRT